MATAIKTQTTTLAGRFTCIIKLLNGAETVLLKFNGRFYKLEKSSNGSNRYSADINLKKFNPGDPLRFELYGKCMPGNDTISGKIYFVLDKEIIARYRFEEKLNSKGIFGFGYTTGYAAKGRHKDNTQQRKWENAAAHCQ